MNEGSVIIDEGGEATTSAEVDSSQEVDTSQEESGEESGKETDADQKDVSQNTETQQLTDKGTKLDTNPLSAAYQQLANANRKIQQMQQVLGNPELLKRYAQQSGISLTQAKSEIKKQTGYTPEQFKTAEDVSNVFNEIRTQTQAELQNLKTENNRLKSGINRVESIRHIEQVANTMQRDIITVQEKYPELNPKSSSYDSDLESSISDLYHELDFDKRSGSYRGRISIAKIADKIMGAAKKAKASGSKQAQTDVKVKKAGRVVTSSKSSSSVVRSKDPATAIAQKIQQTLKRR